MKHIFYVGLMVMVVVTAANTADNGNNRVVYSHSSMSEQVSKNINKKSSALTSGLAQVLASLEELKTVVEKTPVQKAKAKGIAEMVGGNWDKIEKMVNENYPKDYKNIEKSLYPLLAEAKKDYPDWANVRQLLTSTIKKVKTFKEDLVNNSK